MSGGDDKRGEQPDPELRKRIDAGLQISGPLHRIADQIVDDLQAIAAKPEAVPRGFNAYATIVYHLNLVQEQARLSHVAAPDQPHPDTLALVRLIELIKAMDIQAERLTTREQTTWRDGEDQEPRDEDFEEVIVGYKFNTGCWHRILGTIAGHQASQWLQTPEGQARVKEAAERARLTIEELGRAGRIDHKIMHEPFTAGAPPSSTRVSDFEAWFNEWIGEECGVETFDSLRRQRMRYKDLVHAGWDAARLSATRQNNSGLSSIGCWWVMIEAERELAGEPKIPDDAVILSFMGSGASHNVTAKDIRVALGVTTDGTAKG